MEFVHYRPPMPRDAKGKSDGSATKMVQYKDEATHTDARDKSVNGGCQLQGQDMDTSHRPRLNPEAVWLLEQQFLAEPKPSSHTKRHLADLTNLSLTRVSVSAKVKSVRRSGKLTAAELVPEPSSQGEAAEASRGSRALPRR